MKRPERNHRAAFKARMASEALKGVKAMTSLPTEHTGQDAISLFL